MISFEEIENRINKGEELESILSQINWQEFETFVASIFQQHDFRTLENFRFKTKNRYEIDVVAIKNDIMICIDCKQWGRRRSKSSAITDAAKKQVKRVKELKKFLKNNPIAQGKLKIDFKKATIVPLIVSLFEEDLLEIEDVFIVPVWKLNEFLNNSYFI